MEKRECVCVELGGGGYLPARPIRSQQGGSDLARQDVNLLDSPTDG